ncbi:DNA helicase [Tanacetum coccineum]
MELPYMSVERRGLTALGAINSYPDRVVTNGDGTSVPISTVFGRLREMLTWNGGSNFGTRTESPICRTTPVTTHSPHMFVESLGLTGSCVTNSSDGRVVTRADRTTVSISTVFGRFKDMPVSSAEADFTADTDADLRGCMPRGSYVPINNRSHSFGKVALLWLLGAVFPSGEQRVFVFRCWDPKYQTSDFVEAYPSSRIEFLPTYMDLGDCHYECQHCGALFWYNERLKRRQYSRHPEYHLCCGGGKFYMHLTPDPPAFIQQLLRNSHFMENIRAYNQMFAMTSFGVKVDESVNRGTRPYVFKISGQIYHWIRSLCLEDGDHPRFLQMYIYDTDNEVNNRMRHFGGLDAPGLNPEIVEGLIHVLDEHNGLLYNLGGVREYELPTSDVLGEIVFEDGPRSRTNFDVMIEFGGGPPKRISKLHQSYMSLQFPLLFVFGQPGFYPELILKPRNGRGDGRKVTMNAYYKYQLHARPKEFGLLFKSGRLFQQYVVTVLCAIEQSRLDFIRKRQKDLRSDYLSGLYDAISRGDRWGIMVGSIILLPSTFTGGPRYMYSHYLDALAICRSLGNPQFFITFTCNVKWPEIKRYASRYPGLTPADRADIVCRVFQQKVKDFVKFLKEVKTFGRVVGVLYTIEFQKRGLPHCHTLLWVDSKNKITDASQIDEYISAELPDPVKDPRGYKVVSELMLHGPCGAANLSAPCTQNGTCNKKFPKRFNANTFFDSNGHTQYRRRDTGTYFIKHESRLDNCNVMSYNRVSCLAFKAHINVEYCGWNSKQWKRRQIATKKSLGRLTYVHPSSGELFYFRMLMCHQKGCKSPTEVKTVNGEIFPAYRAICEALGLLGDDKE